MGIAALLLVFPALATIIVATPGTPLVWAGLFIAFGTPLGQILWPRRQAIRGTLRAALLWPLLPVHALKDIEAAAFFLDDGQVCAESPPLPSHRRLAVAKDLAKRPWLRHLAGPGAIIGSDPDGVWILGRHPSDGSPDPVAVRRYRKLRS